MEFVNPFMLYGFAALLIPVLIHLFNFRRHKLLYFSNISLLKNLQEQTSRTNKLLHLLVLLCRLLVIAALVMAFARPFLPDENRLKPAKRNLVMVYVDNSLSMQARSEKSTLLDEAKLKATEIAASFNKEDKYIILTNDLNPAHERPMSGDEFIAEINKLNLSHFSRKLSQILGRTNTMRHEGYSQKVVFVLSDFQASTADLGKVVSDTASHYFFVPLTAVKSNNVYVDSCWFESPLHHPGELAEMKARIVNDGSEEIKNLTVRLTVQDEQKAIANVDIAPASSAEVSLGFDISEVGPAAGTFEITDYPVIFDDKLYFSFTVDQAIRVLEIYDSEANPWLKTLLEGDDQIAYESKQLKRLDFQGLKAYKLIILSGLETISGGLSQALTDFSRAGGSLVLVPSPAKVDMTVNALLSQYGMELAEKADTARSRVFSLLTEHPVFKGVFEKIPENADLPNVRKHYSIRNLKTADVQQLITMTNGSAFLAEGSNEAGKAYVFASALLPSWSDFYKNNLFVPVIYRLIFLSANEETLYHYLGTDAQVQIRTKAGDNEQVLHIRELNNDFDLIPLQNSYLGETSLTLNEAVEKPGFYKVTQENEPLAFLAMNDNREESRLNTLSRSQLEEQMKKAGIAKASLVERADIDQGRAFENLSSGTQLWKWFVVLSLIFLLIEGLLLRFWRK
ncbi:MAG: BatA domain-containing protein [Bacteroidales bacterium]|nr:BatA domain-containing protein [Bacteroidales bacterium]